MNRILYLFVIFAILLTSCGSGAIAEAPSPSGLPEEATALVTERGFTPNDIYAALKTYMPSGQTDPYIMFLSGGQSGQVLVIGVPSMRILKIVAVFTPESWQGYGFGGSSMKLIALILQAGFAHRDQRRFCHGENSMQEQQ